MKLQDYIMYYIGCDVIIDQGTKKEDRGKLMGGTFIPNSINQIYYYIQTAEMRENEDEDFTMPYNDDADEPARIKPILRRLSDMTEEEAIRVHREATKTPFLPADKDEYDVTYIKDKSEVCSIEVVDLRIPNTYTNINIEGNVLVYMHEHNKEPKICERVANQNHITHYLLQQQFDLFNLIDAGLAFDAKTIQ